MCLPRHCRWKGWVWVMKKWMKWVAIGLLVLFITTRPAEAADTANDLGGGAASIVGGLLDFLSRLDVG